MKPTNADLIQVAKKMDIGSDYSSCYAALNMYILGMKNNGKNDLKMLYDFLALFRDERNFKKALKVAGKQSVKKEMFDNIKKWSSSVSAVLKQGSYTLDQIHYMIGYAYRLCEISRIDKK